MGDEDGDYLGQLLLLSLVSFGRRGENGDCQVWVFVRYFRLGRTIFVTSSIGILPVGREMKNVFVTLIGILYGRREENGDRSQGLVRYFHWYPVVTGERTLSLPSLVSFG